MKIKNIFIATTAITCALLATQSMATMFLKKGAAGTIVHTTTITTPENKHIELDELKFSIGISQTNPCNDLITIVDLETSFAQPLIIEPGFYTMDTETLDGLGASPAVTCLKIDMLYNNHNYTTGPIHLLMDPAGQHYIQAIPNSTTINFHD